MILLLMLASLAMPGESAMRAHRAAACQAAGSIRIDSPRTTAPHTHDEDLRMREAEVQKLDFAKLVRDVAATAPPAPGPATDDDISAAQARNGTALPEEIVGLYRAADGVPAVHIVPLSALVRARARSDIHLDEIAQDGEIVAWPQAGEAAQPLTVPVDAAGRWLVLTPPRVASLLLYDAGATPAAAGYRLYETDGGDGVTAYRDLRDWLEGVHVRLTRHAARMARFDAAVDAARTRLAALAMPALLAERARTEPSHPLFKRIPTPAIPAAAAIAEAERRIGRPLPDDLRAIYALQNGEMALRIFPVESVRPLDLSRHGEAISAILEGAPLTPYSRRSPRFPVDANALAGCHVIGGSPGREADSPALLWCPEAEAAARILDLHAQRAYPTLTDYVREAVARADAAQVL